MSYESDLQAMKGVNSPFSDTIATCFTCWQDFEASSGDIGICSTCDEPVCVNCRKDHADKCGADCLS